MPIYKFPLTPLGWREILVDIDDSQSSPYNFRFTLSPAATRASVTLLSHPQFHPAPAPAPESDAASSHVYKVGDTVEVAPDAWGVAGSISERVAGSPPSGKHNQSDPSSGGVALIVDYGNDWTEGDSLRAIKQHKHVHVRSTPGECDLSANVDFSLIRSAVNELAEAHGPISQSTFLRLLSITTRLQKLLAVAESQEKRKELAQDYDRLVSKPHPTLFKSQISPITRYVMRWATLLAHLTWLKRCLIGYKKGVNPKRLLNTFFAGLHQPKLCRASMEPSQEPQSTHPAGTVAAEIVINSARAICCESLKACWLDWLGWWCLEGQTASYSLFVAICFPKMANYLKLKTIPFNTVNLQQHS
ncbi:hypothetical protein SeMB42_g07558 [Synchytrium endobioticum]|uniref:Protein arginine methyltransferase NDUFAF7 n=1 Tax=Synchytrium endobioticum TaxID=286115 RepID=A0A507C0P0_9FUNG|nr:hypothetical protein SeMB42_g07558 [Synchytrium endobioticum]